MEAWHEATNLPDFGIYNSASQIVTRSSSNDAFASTSAVNAARPYSVNGLNQYAAVGPNPYTYDPNGNLTSDGTGSYVYDAENRLVSRSNGTTLSYDPLGRLWRTSGNIETTVFEYDGDRLVEEFDASGTRIRVYGHGTGTDEPLMWWEGPSNWQRRYFHADHQGTVIAIANDSGTPQRVNGTDAWGVRNSGDWGRFGLTGQVYLADLGMYYYKARIYSPMLGRFMQTDPVGYKDQVNLYAYVENDPVDGRDPTGLGGQCDTGSRLAGASGGCMVAEGFRIPTQPEGAHQGGITIGHQSYRGPGSRLIPRLLRDRSVRASINQAWRNARGDRGPTGAKNEWGFWVAERDRGFRVGSVFKGETDEGAFLDVMTIERARDDLPGASIFIHVHPFRIGEIPGVTSISLSDGDRRIGLRFNALVISVARPEPYTGRGVFVDYTDDFYKR